MTTKQEALSDPNSCWNKAAPDEPVFILRARDMTSPFLVRQWARHFIMLNGEMVNVGSDAKPQLRLRYSPEVQKKHDNAMRTAAHMDSWHDRKIPD